MALACQTVATLGAAAILSNNLLVEGIVADIISVDQWFRFLPFVTFEGLAYTFTREATLASADFAAAGVSLNAAKYRDGATFTNVNVNLAAIIADIIIDGQIEDQFSETNDQLQVQISSKSKQIARIYMNAIVNADRSDLTLSTANNGPIGISSRFLGVRAILDAESGNNDDVNHPFYSCGCATQSLSLTEDDPGSTRLCATGRVYTLEDLDDAIDRVTVEKPDFILANSREIRTLRVLLRNTGGGTDAFQIQQTGLGSARPQLYYQDIPVFRNDFISKVDYVNTVGTSITACSTACAIIINTAVVLSGSVAATATVISQRGSDGINYRWAIDSICCVTYCVTSTGTFFDPEQNKLVCRIAPNNALLVDATAVVVGEREDGSAIYVGAWGEFRGLTGFTSSNNAGLKLEYVGPRENENAYQYRLKWYTGFDLYNRLALARIKDILPLGS